MTQNDPYGFTYNMEGVRSPSRETRSLHGGVNRTLFEVGGEDTFIRATLHADK